MIYQRGHISVDNHFARFGSKSYAIDKINSVDVREVTKSGWLWICLLFVSLFCLAAAIGSQSDDSWAPFVLFTVLTGLAFWKRPRPRYFLMLATSSGEVAATNGDEPEAIVELRSAIETAMRGCSA